MSDEPRDLDDLVADHSAAVTEWFTAAERPDSAVPQFFGNMMGTMGALENRPEETEKSANLVRLLEIVATVKGLADAVDMIARGEVESGWSLDELASLTSLVAYYAVMDTAAMVRIGARLEESASRDLLERLVRECSTPAKAKPAGAVVH